MDGVDDGLASMTIPCLKDLLRELGCTVSGKKGELIARIRNHRLLQLADDLEQAEDAEEFHDLLE